MHKPFRTLPLSIVLLTLTASARAATSVTWDGSSANWTDSVHWALPSPDYPDADHPAGSTYDVAIPSGHLDLEGGSYTIESLTSGYATLTNGTLTLGDAGANTLLTVPQLNLGARLILGPSATVATAPTAPTLLSLVLHGSLESQGTLTLGPGTVTLNTSSSAFSPQFINSGHLIINPGADQTFFIRSVPSPTSLPDTYPAFLNSGTVDITSGTLYIHAADDGNTTGTFNISAGATLRLDALLTFAPASTIQGAGNVLVQSDYNNDLTPLQPVTFAGAYAITGDTTIDSMQAIFNSVAATGSATLTNAQLSGTGTLTVGGAFSIYRTTFSGLSMVLNGTGSILESNTPASLDIGGITTLTMSSTVSLPALANSAITVKPAGLLILTGFTGQIASTVSITNNGTLNLNSIALQGYQSTPVHPVGLITNNGTLTTTNTSALASSVNFNNNGIIEVRSGSHFTLASPGTDTALASILVDSGGTLQGFRPLLAGSLTNNGFIFLNNSGHYTLGVGTSSFSFTNNNIITLSDTSALTINATYSDAASSSITLNGAGTSLTFNSPFTMLGSVSGAGTFSLSLPPAYPDTGSTLSGPYSLTGLTSLSNAHATFAPSASASTASLLLANNATLSGNLTVTSSLTLDSSTIDAALTTSSANISIKQSTAAAPTLDAATLTIAADHTASIDSDATLHLQHNASLINNGTLTTAHDFTLDANATAGAFKNVGTLTITAGTTTLANDLTFQNPGTVDVQANALLLLAAAQDPLTTGTFTVEMDGTLQLAASYDFSTPAGPTLTGAGLVIIDPGTTLTLAVDTPFTGTIQVDGTLFLAAPRNPDNPDAQPHFTIVSPATPIPEPGSLLLLTIAAPLLARRRR